jgi:hypothetical protein
VVAKRLYVYEQGSSKGRYASKYESTGLGTIKIVIVVVYQQAGSAIASELVVASQTIRSSRRSSHNVITGIRKRVSEW